MSEHVSTPAADPLALSWRRVFYWAVRRELWEYRSLVVAPIVVAAFGLFGGLMTTAWLPSVLTKVAAGSEPKSGLMGPYSFIAGATMMTSFFVAVFYTTNALCSERRDRTLLFWKSLPVSDRTTVLAKATVPIFIAPAIAFAVILAFQLALAAWSTFIAVATGHDPALLWSRLRFDMMWLVLPYGLFVDALWTAPAFAYLLAISAWARRVPFLWAAAPIVAPAMIEAMVSTAGYKTIGFNAFIGRRLFGGLSEAFSIQGGGKAPVHAVSQVDPLRTFTSLDLWGGLVVAVLFLAAAIWLRRRRETL